MLALRQFSIAVALPARAERPLKICLGGRDGSQKQCTLRPRGQSDRNGKLPLEIKGERVTASVAVRLRYIVVLLWLAISLDNANMQYLLIFLTSSTELIRKKTRKKVLILTASA